MNPSPKPKVNIRSLLLLKVALTSLLFMSDPHDDGGWSQSHDVGRLFAQENLAGVHTAYVENVAEGVDSEQVTRSLARKGFDMIFTTSFGFMDATETVAAEFPPIRILSTYPVTSTTALTLVTSWAPWKTSSISLASLPAPARKRTAAPRSVTWLPSPHSRRTPSRKCLRAWCPKKTCPRMHH